MKRHRDSTLCRATGKRRFRDHEEATGWLHKVASRSTRETVPCRTYECSACHGWHVTSQEVWDTTKGRPTRR